MHISFKVSEPTETRCKEFALSFQFRIFTGFLGSKVESGGRYVDLNMQKSFLLVPNLGGSGMATSCDDRFCCQLQHAR